MEHRAIKKDIRPASKIKNYIVPQNEYNVYSPQKKEPTKTPKYKNVWERLHNTQNGEINESFNPSVASK